MAMNAYHGGYWRIDAGTGRAERVDLNPDILRAYLGGVGLGSWILANETQAGVDPLGPESALVVAFSPLVGSPLTTSAKFAVVAISPLTGRVCDALASSRFAIAGKRAGADAFVLKGISDEPAILLIESWNQDDVVVRTRKIAAGDLWGQSAQEAEQEIRRVHGADWQVIAIGPGGERRIPFATISHDGRHAGRGGLGAVMGAKRIKAIAVRGDRRTPLANPNAAIALARSLSQRSLGPATEKYRELGTIANLLVFNRFEALPSRNFQAGRLEDVERLVPNNLAPAPRVARQSCAACAIGCEHVFESPGKRRSGIRLEYESLYALGPLCGVTDPEAVLQAAGLCDDLGLDTISTGGTIAFAMECAERGWIDGHLPKTRRQLRFGDGEALLEAIQALANRDGIGDWLAMGSRRMAERIGGDALRFAPHVKGLELPGYDPRALHTMALGLAVGTRGADHNRSSAYEADFSNQVDRLGAGAEHAQAAIVAEDKAALMDSLILCKFLRGVFVDFHEEAAQMLQAVAGWNVDATELRATAKRIVNLRKRINEREGWTRAEDALPGRLLEANPDPAKPQLTLEQLDRMINEYYRLRGWGRDGRATDSLSERGEDSFESKIHVKPRQESGLAADTMRESD